ncbi:MAG TPA: hypothetical protein VKY15_06600, partial [Acidimicrobiales bacterium]|nr:hypothetical protein [Acidimicrobiales bacterium]
QAWVLAHQAQLAAIDSDQARLRADSPSNGGNPSVWLGDWARFHDDVLAASALPDPGGAASPYWHQMLGYYIKGSSELVGALRAGDAAGQAQAVRDLTAGDQAARQFDQAMGLSSPSG